MSKRVAFLGKAFWDPAGEDPDVLITGLVSVTPDFSAGEISANDRDDPEWEIPLRGRKSGSIDLELNYDDIDPSGFQAALETRFDATDPDSQIIALKFLSHDGGKGYYADWRVFNVSRPEPADGLMTYTVSVKYAGNFTRV